MCGNTISTKQNQIIKDKLLDETVLCVETSIIIINTMCGNDVINKTIISVITY